MGLTAVSLHGNLCFKLHFKNDSIQRRFQTKVQMHAVAIRKLLYDLCVCAVEYPRAKVCGLSSQTHAQTKH